MGSYAEQDALAETIKHGARGGIELQERAAAGGRPPTGGGVHDHVIDRHIKRRKRGGGGDNASGNRKDPQGAAILAATYHDSTIREEGDAQRTDTSAGIRQAANERGEREWFKDGSK